MSPVRWKNTFYIALLLFELWIVVSSNTMQDPITMTLDGWRPIVGTRRQPPGFETDSRIPQFKKTKPTKNLEKENIKSENSITTVEPEQIESSTKPLHNLNAGPQNYGNKIAPHSKYSPPKYQTLPPGAVSLGRPSQYGFRKHSVPAKPAKVVSHLGPAPKRKPPPRGPVGAHSTRNDVFINPSGTITSYPFIKTGLNNVRTRETQGIGLFGTQNHFTVNQPNSHIEINRFPSPNENVFQQYKSPGVSYHLPKLKIGQGDEYSRNLVPPPPSRNPAAEKEKLKNSKFPIFKDNTASVSDPVYEIHESFGKWQDNLNPYTFNYIKAKDSIHNIKDVRPHSTATQITNEPVVEFNLPPFLPTPYVPDPIYPTSATQSEASTVFSQVSQKMNKYKNAALNNNPLFFDIKEVSTHYPILGKPSFIDDDQTANPAKENEIVDEVTTPREEITTKKRRRRPQPRRPVSTTTTTTTTTTEEPPITEVYQIKSQEDIIPETEKPLPKRIRQRPNRYKHLSGSSSINQESSLRYRTTTPVAQYEENNEEKRTRGRNRYRQRGSGNKDSTELQKPVNRKRTRPTTTEMPANHKIMEKEKVNKPETVRHDSRYSQKLDVETTTKEQRIIDYEENNMSDENMSEEIYESTPNANFIDDIGLKVIRTTTPPDETTLINNEIELSTPSSQSQNNQDSLIETTLATIIPTSTTTESKTTVKHNRIKTRPASLKTSNRPRFSVKDYRQRLNQHTTSSTPPSTTDILKAMPEVPRIRFPARLRTRPTQYSTTTPAPPPEETTTEILLRRRFKPKDPRHTVATESTNIIPETNVKSVNTRLRPFDRQKINAELTTKSTVEDSKVKASIKSSLYSNRRRPSIGIRKINKTEDAIIKDKQEEKIDEEKDDAELTTEYQSVKISTTEISPTTTIDINENDYSQRVSELTSSFKEYETPGLFKNVAPISRRVPNYFTLSTEDPILPIEAFFPGINEKDKET
ncbi:mucin-2-like isoform X3 [Diorhabda carinulata]|uniref:mucin-2-like isoform X3 n=1 Tax=Diorhabda carinulata TaxID=1163345 RepID=UPI0025A18017|nr:mucin-2-like isoform X3 [Diorhabda carinulata]